jgi:hypothetical protein
MEDSPMNKEVVVAVVAGAILAAGGMFLPLRIV